MSRLNQPQLSSAADVDRLEACLLNARARGESVEVAVANFGDKVLALSLLGQDDFIERVDAAWVKFESSGKAAKVLARKVTFRALQRIDQELETAGAFEAAELCKPALKVLEQEQRAELAQRDQYANLPVIHVTFGPGMELSTEVKPTLANVAPTQSGVVDVEVKSPVGSLSYAERDEPPNLLPAALTPEEQATLDALNVAGGAYPLGDEVA